MSTPPRNLVNRFISVFKMLANHFGTPGQRLSRAALLFLHRAIFLPLAWQSTLGPALPHSLRWQATTLLFSKAVLSLMRRLGRLTRLLLMERALEEVWAMEIST